MKKIFSVISKIILAVVFVCASLTVVGCAKKETIETSMISLSSNSFIYDGTEKKPSVTVITKTGEKISSSEYTVAYSDNVNVGTASVTVAATKKSKKLSGSAIVHFKIRQAEINSVTVSADSVYDGQSHIPQLSVQGNTLPNTYQVSWEYKSFSSNVFEKYLENKFVNAGIYRATISGNSNYVGTKVVEYKISKATVKKPTISGEYTYNGENQTATLSNYDSNLVTVQGQTQKDAGNHRITLTLKDTNNYMWADGSSNPFTLTFTISKVKVEKPTISGEYTYTGENQTATLSYNDNNLFTVQGLTQKDAGEHTVTVTLNDADNYMWTDGSGESLTLTFTISKVKVEIPKSVEVTYNGKEQTVYAETDEYSVEGGTATDVQKTGYTATLTLKDSNNYEWNSTEHREDVSVEVGYKILARDVKEATITLGEEEYRYTKGQIKPSVIVKIGEVVLAKGTDYEVSYGSNTYVAEKGTVTISGKGNYSGNTLIEFSILPAKVAIPESVNLTYNGEEQTAYTGTDEYTVVSGATKIDVGNYEVKLLLNDIDNFRWENTDSDEITVYFVINPMNIEGEGVATITLTPNEFEYTGNEIEPEEKVVINGKALEKDKDYTVSYMNNKDKGAGKVIITGKGNYTGEVIATFSIGYKLVDDTKISVVDKGYTFTGLSQTVEMNFGDVDTSLFNVFGTTFTDAGSHTVTLSLKNENCIWSSTGNSLDVTKVYFVSKKEVEKPTITGEYTYNGESQTATISNYDSNLVTVQGLTQKDAGEHIVTATLNNTNNYMWTDGSSEPLTLIFTISKVKVEIPKSVELTYNREEQTVYTETDEYRVINATATIVGEYTAKLTLKDSNNYEWNSTEHREDVSVEVEFRILPREIRKDEITLGEEEYRYTKGQIKPSVIVKIGEVVLAEGTDYEVSYGANTYVAEKGTVTISGKGNYSGSAVVEFDILPAKVAIPESVNLTYNGEEQTAYTSTDEYTAINAKATNAGENYTATLTLVDAENCVWSDGTKTPQTLKYTIDQANIESVEISLDKESYPYTGEQIKPEVTLEFLGKELSNDTDYIVAYGENVNKGTGTITVTGKGNFTGTKTQPFIIDYRIVEVPTITSTHTYNGEIQNPVLSYTDGSIFTVENISTANAGKQNIVLKLIDTDNNIWSTGKIDDVTLEFVIEKAEVEEPKTELSFIYDTTSKEAVYVYENSKYAVDNGTHTDAGTYEVRVYLLDEDNYKWKNKGDSSDIIFDMTILPADITEENSKASIIIEDKPYVYTGNEIKPKVVIRVETFGYTFADDDYDVLYSNNINVGYGMITIKVKEKKNYTGEMSTTFEITQKIVKEPTIAPVTYDGQPHTALVDTDEYQVISEAVYTDAGKYEVKLLLNDKDNFRWENTDSDELTVYFVINPINIEGENVATVTLTPDEFEYTGNEIEPKEKVVVNGNTLVKGTDYTVEYEDNVNKGAGKVIITGIGNYAGEVTATFSIGYKLVDDTKISIVDKGYTFTGLSQTVEMNFGDVDTSLFNVFGNTFVGAGSHTVTLSLKNKNCIWSSTGDSHDVTKTYFVSKATVEKPTIIGEYTYKGKNIGQTATLSYNDSNLFTAEGLTQENAGDYPVIIELIDTDNYIWADGSSESLTLIFTISKVTVEKPEIIGEYTYTGDWQTATLSYNDSNLFTVKGLTQENAGDYPVTVTLNDADNYMWADGSSEPLTLTFTISKVKVEIPKSVELTYNGEEQTAYTETDEYSAINATATIVGEYTATLTLKDSENYEWNSTEHREDVSVEVGYKISARDVKEATITLGEEEYRYTKGQIKPSVIVKIGEVVLAEGTDYEVSYGANTYVAEKGTVTISGKGNYSGSAVVEFDILPAKVDIPSPEKLTYNREKQIGYTSTELYNVAEEGEIDAGENYTATLTLVDVENCVWSDGTKTPQTLKYTIDQANIESAEISLDQDSYPYTGEQIKPEVTLEFLGKELSNDTDYIVAYGENVNKGTGTITVTGKGNFTGTKTQPFIIGYKSVVTPYIIGTYTYTGIAQSASLSYTDDTLFSVINNSYINAGKHSLILILADKSNSAWSTTGKADDITLEFEIEKEEVEKPTIVGEYTYNGEPQTAELSYTDDSIFEVTGLTQTEASVYDVTVILNDQTNYKWEKGDSSNLALSFEIKKYQVAIPEITYEVTFNGDYQTAVTANDDYYIVTNGTQRGAGDYDVSIKLANKNYEWSDGSTEDITFTFKVLPITLTTENVVFVNPLATYYYNGNEIKPAVRVFDNDEDLIKDVDYTLEYESNKNAGKNAMVVVTGRKNYSGEVKLQFTINKYVVNEPLVGTETYKGQPYTINNSSDIYTFNCEPEYTDAGTYPIVVSLNDYDNYRWKNSDSINITIYFVIEKAIVEQPTIAPVTYDGQIHTALVNTDNYTVVSGAVQKDAGKYKVKLSLNYKDNFRWENADSNDIEVDFEIKPILVDEPSAPGEYTYNGNQQTAIAETDFYSVQNGTETDANTYTITVSLKDKNNYNWKSDKNKNYDLTYTFTIKQKNISTDLTIDYTYSHIYTSAEIKPAITNAKVGELELGEDFDVSYYDNTDVGEGKIKVVGKGNFTGSKEFSFEILPIEIEKSEINISPTSAVYNGSVISVSVSVVHNEYNLEEDEFSFEILDSKNNSVSLDSFIDAGSYTIVVSGSRNYAIDESFNFVVEKAEQSGFTIRKGDYTYGEHTPTEIIGTYEGSISLLYSLDGINYNHYEDSYDINAGSYYVKAVASGTLNYKPFESERVQFLVSQTSRDEVTISTNNENNQFNYGDKVIVSVNGYSGNNYVVYYYPDGQSAENATDFSKVTKPLDAGNYHLFIVIPADTNYTETITSELQIVINPIKYSDNLTVSRGNYKYGQTKTPTILSGYDGDMSTITVTYYYNLSDSNVNGIPYKDVDDLDANTYYIYAVISADKNHIEQKTETNTFIISKADYSDVTISVSGCTYGEVLSTPTIQGTVYGEVTYHYIDDSSNIFDFTNNLKLDAGTYYAYADIASSKNYNEYTTPTYEFIVAPIKIEKPTADDATFTGNQINPISSTVEYNVSDIESVNAGTYHIPVALVDKKNYTWSDGSRDDILVNFVINKANISNASYSIDSDNIVYDGKAKTPSISLTLGTYKLKSTDFDVEYENNINAGNNAIIRVISKDDGNFSGNREFTFTINKASYSNEIFVSKASYTYGSLTSVSLSQNVEGSVTFYYSTENSNERGTPFDNSTIFNAGTYYIFATISGSDNYNPHTTGTRELTVYRASISSAAIYLEDYSFDWTGEEIEPKVLSVVLGVKTLASTDYEVTYENNVNAGDDSAKVIVTGVGNYTNTVTVSFSIVTAGTSISSAQITFNDGVSSFESNENGEPVEPAITVTLGEVTLVKGTDYTVSYSNNTDDGTATVTVTGIGNYYGTASTTFTIYSLMTLRDADISLDANYDDEQEAYLFVYTGKAISYHITVELDGDTIDSSEYTVTWVKRVNGEDSSVDKIQSAGEYIGTVTATETSLFNGSASQKIRIIVQPLEVTVSQITLRDTSKAYTGGDLSGDIKVWYNKLRTRLLILGSDYTVVWRNSDGEVVTEIVERGEYTGTLIVSGGNYYCEEEIEVTFEVV